MDVAQAVNKIAANLPQGWRIVEWPGHILY